jgi:hypothetical protein
LIIASNLVTNFGVVLLARTNPQPFSKITLTPSTVIISLIFGKSEGGFCKATFKSSMILNFVSSVTVIFISGVE